MNRKFSLRLLVSASLLSLLVGVVAGFLGQSLSGVRLPARAPFTVETFQPQAQAAKPFEVIKEAAEKIAQSYFKEISPEGLKEAAIRGMLLYLQDRHSAYYTKTDLRMLMEDYKGEVSGVGLMVLMVQGKLTVVAAIKGTPAEKAGIVAGDVIEKVDDQAVSGMDVDKAVALIRGPAGTKVRLSIRKVSTNELVEIELTREKFRVPNVESRLIDQNAGYVRYFSFVLGGSEEAKKSIDGLISSGARGIILDLRGNGGGALSDAVELARLFISSGRIVTLVSKGVETEKYDATGARYPELPLVILVNRYSASATELFTGAIQDHSRAVIVGERSFGKGSVQNIIDLSDGSGVKVTSALYLLPSGRSVEGVGIMPDIVVKDEMTEKEDKALDEAVKVLKELIGGASVEELKKSA